MIICPSAFQGKTVYETGSEFLKKLKLYDPCLEAYRDNRRQAIVVWATRQGGKRVHEFTLERKEGEMWGEFENRIIFNLPQGDIWKRFGTGKAFDDYLKEQATKAREEKLKDVKHNRLEKVKQEVDKIKFDHDLRCKRVPGATLKGA